MSWGSNNDSWAGLLSAERFMVSQNADLPVLCRRPCEHEERIGQRGDDVEDVGFIIGAQDWSIELVRITGP
jgi:hypothetical protein